MYFFPLGAAPRYICTYYDVIEYLNISSHSKLHTHILPKTHWKEPMEVMMDFMLIAILSVVRMHKCWQVFITEICATVRLRSDLSARQDWASKTWVFQLLPLLQLPAA